MPKDVALLVNRDGAMHSVTVDSRRFTIGSTPDNDLVLDDEQVSRRHAVIECFDDAVTIYDLNSEFGTLLNNAPLTRTAVLHSGDLLTFGGTCDVTVQIGTSKLIEASKTTVMSGGARPSSTVNSKPTAPPTLPTRPPLRVVPKSKPQTASGSWTNSYVVVAAISVFAVISISVAVLLARKHFISPVAPENLAVVSDNRAVRTTDPVGSIELQSSSVSKPAAVSVTADEASLEEIERAAVRVMRRISSDDKAYVFPEAAIEEIKRKIDDYRNASELAGALAALQRNGRAIAVEAREMNVEPNFVFYLALADTNGGRASSDVVAAARQMVVDLQQLRATFGGSDADGILLVVAAHTEGTGTRKSHPLLATLRRLVHNPMTERNVWFLRERGGLSSAAYDFVISFVALGIIAQNPSEYGINAEPLLF